MSKKKPFIVSKAWLLKMGACVIERRRISRMFPGDGIELCEENVRRVHALKHRVRESVGWDFSSGYASLDWLSSMLPFVARRAEHKSVSVDATGPCTTACIPTDDVDGFVRHFNAAVVAMRAAGIKSL